MTHYINAFNAAETIFFKMLANPIINQSILTILSKTNAFHTINDIHEVYNNRYSIMKYNNGDVDKIMPNYQLLGERNSRQLLNTFAGLILDYPHGNHREKTFLDNLEQSKFFTHKEIMGNSLYHSIIPPKTIKSSFLEKLVQNNEYIGTNNSEWKLFKTQLYVNYPNLPAHVELIKQIMFVLSRMDNCNLTLIQDMQPAKIENHSQNIFYIEKIDGSVHQKIMCKPYHEDFKNFINNMKQNYEELDNVFSFLIHEYLWIEELIKEEIHYPLYDIKFMIPNYDTPNLNGMKMTDIIHAQENGKNILWNLQINDPKMSHFNSFGGHYFLPNSNYTQSFIFNLYIHAMVLINKLNWTEEEFEIALESANLTEEELLKDYSYYNQDGSPKTLNQIMEEQSSIRNKYNSNILFGNRNNDIIKCLINIGEELVWNLNPSNTQFNQIIL